MRDNVEVDLPNRRERRYIILSPKTFLDEISGRVDRKKFSDNEYVRTIYFNNDEHTVPFGVSLKARTYLPQSTDKPTLSEDHVHFLDVKKGTGGIKEKTRFEGTLREIAGFVNRTYRFYGEEIRPYLMVEYLRQHYTPKGAESVRLTLDTDLRYFYFPSSITGEVQEIGKESGYAILELKEASKDQSNEFVTGISDRLRNFPVMSKKCMAFNFLNMHKVKTFGSSFFKELTNREIEAKLELEADPEGIFHGAKNLFSTTTSNFRLSRLFPYTLESGGINRYYVSSEGPLKAVYSRDKVKFVRKDGDEIAKNRLGLDCILKRNESKGAFVPIDSQPMTTAVLSGEIYKMRKAFWVENQETTRIYHISLDRCDGPPGVLYEMEIEYTGRRSGPTEADEEVIVDDIAQITKDLVETFPSLKPSQLTKQAWISTAHT